MDLEKRFEGKRFKWFRGEKGMSGWKRLFIVLSVLWAIVVGTLSSFIYHDEIGRYDEDACWRYVTAKEKITWQEFYLSGQGNAENDGFTWEELDRRSLSGFIPDTPVWNHEKTAYIAHCDEKNTNIANSYYWQKNLSGVSSIEKVGEFSAAQQQVVFVTVLALIMPPLVVYLLFIAIRWVVKGFKE